MSNSSLQILNTVLDRLSHSLLQYIGESWPWSSPLEPQQQENILRLVQRQQFGADRIAEFLTDQGAVVLLGNYRFDGSPLNYCTVEFVKPQLISDQTQLIAELRTATTELNGDSAAVRLLEQLITEEEDTLKQLHEL